MISKKQDGRAWTGFIELMRGRSTGSCEYGNKPSVPIKFRKFFDQLKIY